MVGWNYWSYALLICVHGFWIHVCFVVDLFAHLFAHCLDGIAGKYTVGLGIADFDNMAITCMSDFDSAPTSALLVDVEMAGIVGKDASGKLCWDVDLWNVDGTMAYLIYNKYIE